MSIALEQISLADEPLFEIIDGQRVELIPMGALESRLASYLAAFINIFALETIGLACVETLFDLRIGRNRRPDVSFLRYDRWPRLTPVPVGEAWNVIPNLAAEVISPSNTQQEVIDKLVDYFRAGVSLVWVIHPLHGQVYVYTSIKGVRVLDLSDTLDGGSVIPGFQLPLAILFESNAASPT